MAKKFLFYLMIFFVFISCEKEVPLPQMNYVPQIVLEGYLQPGKPFYLNLSQSSNYSKKDIDLIYHAIVLIKYDSIVDTLKTKTYYDREVGRYYYYSSDSILVPFNYTSVFYIDVTDTLDGRKINAETRILPIVPIDTLVINSENGIYEVKCEFKDNSISQDYYRLVINKDIRGKAILDTIFDDSRLSSSNNFSSGYSFQFGDSVFVSLYHIDYNYYNYLFTIRESIDASYSPISAPTQIKSNVNGGLGIFTGLSFDRKGMKIN